MNPPVLYIPPNDIIPQDAFLILDKTTPWVKVTDAREECFMSIPAGLSYTYGSGKGVRTYISVEMSPKVYWIQKLMHANYPETRGTDICFLNKYADEKNSLYYHSDNSPEIDPEFPVISVSYGAEREIWLRPIGQKGDPTHKYLLQSGSVFVMLPGMQATWEHRIPKCDRPCGPRISLTYRRFKPNATITPVVEGQSVRTDS